MSDDRCALDDVLITDELGRRSSRPPDHAAEAQALGALAQALATDPRGLLQRVVDTAMALCRAGSAGVSVLEPGGEHGAVRWYATAGAFAPHALGSMPRPETPCGEAARRDTLLLVDRPGRHYRALDGVDPPVGEGLLAPWHAHGAPAGTLWVLHHAPDRHFDAEDARLLASVARFAAAAWQTVRALEAAEAGQDAPEGRAPGRAGELDAAAGLRASEARARTLIATLPGAATFVIDHDLRYQLADGEALRMAGFTPEMFAGRAIAEVLDPALAAEYTPLFRQVLAGVPFEWEHAAHGNVYLSRGVPLRDGAGRPTAALVVSVDVTAQRAAEAGLRAAEARHAFLLALSDALRPLGDAEAVKATASRLLGERLRANRVCYVEVEGDDWLVGACYEDGVAPLPLGRFAPALYGRRLPDALRAGHRVADEDVRRDPAVSPDERDQRLAFGMVAAAAVGLRKEGRLAAVLVVHAAAPRAWTAEELGLVEETAERTWAAVQRARTEAALRASEARLAVIFAQAAVGLSELSAEGRFLRVNDELCRIVGRPSDVLTGLDVWAVTHPDDFATTRAAVGVALASGGPATLDKRYVRPDGAVVWSSSSVMRLTDARGRPGNLLAVTLDISARKQAEAALRASEARYRTLVENVHDYAIYLLDADGLITEWTAGAERVKGYTAAEALGRPLALFYTPEDVAAGVPARELAEVAAAGRGEWEGWRVRRDGTRFWADEIGTAVRDADGHLVGFVKISRDLTERRRAAAFTEQAQRAAARDGMRRALAQAEEAERRRLARELHDQLGQELTAVRLGLDEAARLAGAHEGARAAADAPLLRRLAQLQTLAQRMTTGVRYLALELRPPELDDLGLESALATFVAEWSTRFGVRAEVAVTGGLERALPPEVGSTLYRITQEALTNVAKHAAATHVSVIVEKPDGEVRLIVEDDGRGFDPDAAAARVRRERRLGLAGMRERAALVGGTLAIESSPGQGTTVYVRLPVDPAPDDGDAHARAAAPPAPASALGAAPGAVP